MSLGILKKYHLLVSDMIASGEINTNSENYNPLKKLGDIIDIIIKEDIKRSNLSFDIKRIPNEVLEHGEWIKSGSRFAGNDAITLCSCFVELGSKSRIGRAIMDINSGRCFYPGVYEQDSVGPEIDGDFKFAYWRYPHD